MLQPNLFEREEPIAGVDEAGRGPLAGPVVAAAVILSVGQDVSGYADSKRLSADTRERLAGDIRRHALAWSVAWADAAEIDSLNILNATMLAMRRAILGLNVRPASVLVDGNRLPSLVFADCSIAGDAVVGGDGSVPAISAASILAKTVRDEMMTGMDRIFPQYEFGRHKGYGTAVHRERLAEHGPCQQHRRTFAPVRAALAGVE